MENRTGGEHPTLKSSPRRGTTRKPYRPKPRAEIARNMSAIRSTDNKTERALRRELHSRGLRYRKYRRDLPGKPDIVFPSAKVAVFVDGDYWHCRVLKERGLAALQVQLRTPTRAYWLKKFQRRVELDASADKSLRKLGWLVIRLWESDVRANVTDAANAIVRRVRHRQKRAQA